MGRKTLIKIEVAFLVVLMIMIAGLTAPASADQITIDLPKTDVSVVKDADGYAKFSGENIQYLSQPGEPAIPYIVVKALLPPGSDLSTVEVEVQRSAVQSEAVQSAEEWMVRPMPVPEVNPIEEPVLNASGEDEAVYNTSIRFPYSLVGGVSTGEIWEWQLVDIPIALFQFNPVTQRLYTLDASQAIIKFQHKTSRSATTRALSGMGRDRVRNLAVNYHQMESEYPVERTRRSLSSEKSSYVVITTNAIYSTSSQIDAFVQHKESRGYAVRVITENIWGGGTGDFAAENIRNWLKENYEALNIEYVLLIGNPHPENGDVPMKMLWPRNNATYYKQYKESPSDYYYADLTGNWDLDGDGKHGEGDDDFGPGGVDKNYEVIVGRIPYYENVSELDSILSKIISYQNDPNQNWRKRVLLPMEPSDCITPGYHLSEEIKDKILVPKNWNYYRISDIVYNIPGDNYDECRGKTIIPPPPGNTEKTPCSTTNVTNSWKNNDYGAVFWWTHGWYDSASDIMDNANVASLDNSRPAFTFQCSCLNSHPETANNLGYSLLRNGAIATVGATRVSWYWPSQMSFEGTTSNAGMTFEYAKRLIKEGKTCGYALHDMKQFLAPSWMNHTVFCLYGDPEVSIIESAVTDNPPSISDIPDQTTQRDTDFVVPFLINDDNTPLSEIAVTAISSNTQIVPNENIVIEGIAEERTVKIIPALSQTGSLSITITVDDGKYNTKETFNLVITEMGTWLWQNPLPHGNGLGAVWKSPEGEVFSVGALGTIIRYDGNSLITMESGTSIGLTDIWGRSNNDIFAVGYSGTVLHYDGNQWLNEDVSAYTYFSGIWGIDDQVFAVGSSGTIIHYNGSQWVEMDSGTENWLIDVWGTADDDIFVVGSGGIILHYDGTTWEEMLNPAGNNQLSGIWGSSPTDVFVAGGNGIVLYYDGISWSTMDTDVTHNLYGVSGSLGSGVFAVGGFGTMIHYFNGKWNKVPFATENGLVGVCCVSKNSVFAVGLGGAFFHFDGSEWQEITQNTIQHFEGGITGDSNNNIYAVGGVSSIPSWNSTIFKYQSNNGWSEFYHSTDYGMLNDVCCYSGNKVIAVGQDGLILHYDGNSWVRMTSPVSDWLYGVWGNSENNLYAVGQSGTILKFNGADWIELPKITTNYLTDVFGIQGSIFAVGYNGTILQHDGSNWKQMPSGTSEHFQCIWGTSIDDVYAGGFDGVYHYNGSQWKKMEFSHFGILYDIWGSSPNDIFAVGFNTDGGLILHYDGAGWKKMDSDCSNRLYGVWGNSGANVYAVGGYGTILHYSTPAGAPVLSVNPLSSSIAANSGTTTFSISNAGTGSLAWQASEKESWFIISPPSGGNSDNFTVTYQANPGDERTGEITIIADGAANSPKIVSVTQAQKQNPHFSPSWTGNPYNGMAIWVAGAVIDSQNLTAGDEIGVFDGSKCVGAAIVSNVISPTNMLKVMTSQDDGSGNGFISGHDIAIRIWNASRGVEETGVNASFKDITDGSTIDPPGFTPNGDVGVILDAGNQQQNISMTAGWNIMSIPVVPDNTNMMQIVQPLIDSGKLIKVIDEKGNRIIQIFGSWTNEIGSFDPKEGYQIKLASDATISLQGASTMLQSNMYASDQNDIELFEGWNIISYPHIAPQDAMSVVQPIIASGALEKVIDEQGRRILKIFGSWTNEIGNLEPGEGYQVKVKANTWLSIREPGANQRTKPRNNSNNNPVYFTSKVWTQNPYNSMMLRVIGIEAYGVEPGDEIAVFDGAKCVGVGVVEGAVTMANRVDILTSQDDGTGNGFTPGNVITFQFWDASKNNLVIDVAPAFIDMDGNPRTDAPAFEPNADYGVTLTVSTGRTDASLSDAIIALKLLTGIYINPKGTHADADNSGRVQISDAVYILQEVAGLKN